jgi:hypothetical protein
VFGWREVRRKVRGGQCSHHPLDPDVDGLGVVRLLVSNGTGGWCTHPLESTCVGSCVSMPVGVRLT